MTSNGGKNAVQMEHVLALPLLMLHNNWPIAPTDGLHIARKNNAPRYQPYTAGEKSDSSKG
jgi:hypothetical protein